MTTNKTNRIIANRSRLLRDIAALDRVILEVAASGTASATLSSSGGSKSYTRQDLDKLRALRRELASRASALSNLLTGSSAGVRHILTTRLAAW